MRSIQSYKSKKSIKSEANLEYRVDENNAIQKINRNDRKGVRSVRGERPLTVQNDDEDLHESNSQSDDSKTDQLSKMQYSNRGQNQNGDIISQKSNKSYKSHGWKHVTQTNIEIYKEDKIAHGDFELGQLRNFSRKSAKHRKSKRNSGIMNS